MFVNVWRRWTMCCFGRSSGAARGRAQTTAGDGVQPEAGQV